MNPLSEVALLVARELRRNFRSAKGLVLLALCALMAAGAAMALVGAEHAADELARHGRRGSGMAMSMVGAEATRKMLEQVYSEAVADRLASVPRIVLTMMAGAVMFAPSFIAMLSFDSVSAELQFRGVRYWTVRMRRSSYFLGKVAGVFVVAATAVLVAQAIAWSIAISRGSSPVAETLTWGLILWVNVLPIVLAWCSMAVFVSALVRTPIVALMINFACNIALWVAWAAGRFPDRAWLQWLYPNHADRYLLSNDPIELLTGLGACFAFAAVFAIGGVVIFQQRDV
jgi:ABC-type transport system involved in multi-copper enzyme maturation permease subunit